MHPVLFSIGGIEIRFYGLMYAISFFIGIEIAKYMARERNYNEKIIENYALVAMISGLIGGRLYYVLFNLQDYLQKPWEILATWHGGMAIHGGIIGGIIGTFIYAHFKKLNPLTLGDYAAAPLLLGQALGRFGNFMNGEIHGVPVFTPWKVIFSLKPSFYTWYSTYQNSDILEQIKFKNLVPWGIVFPRSSPAGYEFPNIPVHPAMLYELILNFLGFLFLFFALRRKKNKAPGYLWWNYIIIYSVIRIFVSFFRAEDLMIGGIRAPHLVSLLLIIFSLIMLKIGERKQKKLNN
ncbi:prolipoprotein diacylglyceryl transferase [Fusobacterium sp.]|uniref:prolipoprotein diacylglyceryl transferase n=1 Tax=Fusobacterium sp. TaxID=68766 RepID=UPI00396C53C0